MGEVMHELSIALSILDMAAEEAQRHGGARVRGIYLRLGPLAGVVKEALMSAYELARDAESFGDATLVIEEVPIVARCSSCRADRAVVAIDQICCATCGTPTPDIVSGRELEVFALEIE
jgi:hydrogenase nickel incorporation protein HypA/HybF